MEPPKRSTKNGIRLPLLLGLAVVLAGAVAWDRWSYWTAGTRSEGASPPRTPATKKVERAIADAGEGGKTEDQIHALAHLDLNLLHDTIRRPLFEKTRRPVVSPPAVVVKAAPAKIVRPTADQDALTLLGVLFNEAGGAIALLRRKRTGQNVRLQEGDAVDGWTIERIETEQVFLRDGETKMVLQMFRKR